MLAQRFQDGHDYTSEGVLRSVASRSARRTRDDLRAFALDPCVRAVTERGFLAVLAAAKPSSAILFRPIGLRKKARSAVRTITKRLLVRAAAGTPVIDPPRFDLNRVGRFLRHNRTGHLCSPVQTLTILGGPLVQETRSALCVPARAIARSPREAGLGCRLVSKSDNAAMQIIRVGPLDLRAHDLTDA